MAGYGKYSICDSNPGIQFAGKGRGNGRETFIFPNKGKGKGKNSKTGKTGTLKKPKCSLCGGKHWNLMFCPKLPQYLPYGNSQVQAPASLCVKCM